MKIEYSVFMQGSTCTFK